MTKAEGFRAAGPNESLLLTPEEAARLLRIGRTTVYALIKAGDPAPGPHRAQLPSGPS
jgi:predicted DNA-binding transcriptional regulator AlpA